MNTPSTIKKRAMALEDVYHTESDRLFAEFLAESGLDSSFFTNSPSFERYICHLNRDARMPQVLDEEPASPLEPEIKVECDDFEETNLPDGNGSYMEMVIDAMRTDHTCPCILCLKPILTHQSILLHPNDAIKVLMAAVISKSVTEEHSEGMIQAHPLRMCTKHNDQVFNWIRFAIGAGSEEDVDSAASNMLLGSALNVYKRLKLVRELYDGKTPTNPTIGSFKLAMKSYFRNFVPLGGQKTKPKVNVTSFMKNAPVNMPFRNFLKEENVALTPTEELNLLSSIQTTSRRAPTRIQKREPAPYDPLAVYTDAALAAAREKRLKEKSTLNPMEAYYTVERGDGPELSPNYHQEGTSTETMVPIHNTRRFMRVVPKPLRGVPKHGRGKFVLRPEPPIEEKPELFDDLGLEKRDSQRPYSQYQAHDMELGNIVTNDQGVIEYTEEMEPAQEVKEEYTDEMEYGMALGNGAVDHNVPTASEQKPEGLLQQRAQIVGVGRPIRVTRLKRPREYELEEKKQIFHLDLRTDGKKKKITVIVAKEKKPDAMVLDLRSKKVDKSADEDTKDQ